MLLLPDLPALAGQRLDFGDDDVVEWLAHIDATPGLLPRWPKSKHLTLVAAVRVAPSSPATAYVITQKDQLELLADVYRRGGRILFFCVPRRSVLAADVKPKELTSTAWDV